MAITASGLFGLTLEKCFIDTLGESLEAADIRVAMITDSATPNFDTMDFWNDLNANEVSGTGYTAGGELLGTPLVLPGGVGISPAGVLTYDGGDVSWASSTISNAMAAVGKTTVSGPAADQLIFLSDFVSAASSSNGTFTIQWSATGIFTIDYTP